MYDHLEVEKKWQKYWADHETFKTDVWDFSKPKFYALDMFQVVSDCMLDTQKDIQLQILFRV